MILPGISGIAGVRASGGGGGPTTDPHFSSVKLLMGFEGSNGDTGSPGMDDESSATHGTASGGSGSVNISTVQKKFGASSLLVNGASIYFPNSADFEFGSGNFTVEMWIYPSLLSGVRFLASVWINAGNLSWVLYTNGSQLAWNTSEDGTANNSDMSGGTLSSSVWSHVAVDYDGSKYRLYVNGSMVGSFSTPRTLFNSPDTLGIGGASSNSGAAFFGYIDELRITKGVARYANDGGFSVPTVAFPRS